MTIIELNHLSGLRRAAVCVVLYVCVCVCASDCRRCFAVVLVLCFAGACARDAFLIVPQTPTGDTLLSQTCSDARAPAVAHPSPPVTAMRPTLELRLGPTRGPALRTHVGRELHGRPHTVRRQPPVARDHTCDGLQCGPNRHTHTRGARAHDDNNRLESLRPPDRQNALEFFFPRLTAARATVCRCV